VKARRRERELGATSRQLVLHDVGDDPRRWELGLEVGQVLALVRSAWHRLSTLKVAIWECGCDATAVRQERENRTHDDFQHSHRSDRHRSSVTDPAGPTGRLATWVAQTTLADVPPSVRDRAKHLVLDGIGCALVGAQLPWSRIGVQGVTALDDAGILYWSAGEAGRPAPRRRPW
jgi:MmgE/PrpD N-terminal domain